MVNPLTRILRLPILLSIVSLVIDVYTLESDMANSPNGLTTNGNNNPDEVLTSSTLAIVPLQVFPKGSVKLADLEQLMARVNSQAPMPNSSMNNVHNHTIQNHIRSRERLKQERLLSIQAQILQRLGLSGRNGSSTSPAPPPPPPPAATTAAAIAAFTTTANNNRGEVVGRKLYNLTSTIKSTYFDDLLSVARNGVTDNDHDYATSEIYAQRLQSFYPSCLVPNGTEDLSWHSNGNGRQMKLYFDLTIPRSHNLRTHITIMWAKLRLYLFAAPSCVKNQIGTSTDTSTYLDMMVHCETSTITISLFQYMRPLKPNRKERRRMLDSRTVPSSYRGSIEFNMQSVINYWQNMPDRNYGLVVMVEDAFGKSQQPVQFLHQMNCSDSDVPLPNVADLYNYNHSNNNNNNANNNNNNNSSSQSLPDRILQNVPRSRYPTLDLMTMETVLDQNVPGTTGSTVSFLATTIFQSSSASSSN